MEEWLSLYSQPTQHQDDAAGISNRIQRIATHALAAVGVVSASVAVFSSITLSVEAMKQESPLVFSFLDSVAIEKIQIAKNEFEVNQVLIEPLHISEPQMWRPKKAFTHRSVAIPKAIKGKAAVPLLVKQKASRIENKMRSALERLSKISVSAVEVILEGPLDRANITRMLAIEFDGTKTNVYHSVAAVFRHKEPKKVSSQPERIAKRAIEVSGVQKTMPAKDEYPKIDNILISKEVSRYSVAKINALQDLAQGAPSQETPVLLPAQHAETMKEAGVVYDSSWLLGTSYATHNFEKTQPKALEVAEVVQSSVQENRVEQSAVVSPKVEYPTFAAPSLNVVAPALRTTPQQVVTQQAVSTPAPQQTLIAEAPLVSTDNAKRQTSSEAVPEVNVAASSSASEALLQEESQSVTQSVLEQKGKSHFYSAQVFEAFSENAKVIQKAQVNIVGTEWSVETDEHGRFQIDSHLGLKGSIPVVVTKPGFRKRVLTLKAEKQLLYKTKIELVSDGAVEKTALALEEKVADGTGFVFGQVFDPEAGPLNDYKIELLNDQTKQNAVYISDEGKPDLKSGASSRQGQFVFTNLRPGDYFLLMTDRLGRERAAHPIHVTQGEGIVRVFSAGEKRNIVGIVRNAMVAGSRVQNARVQFVGSAQYVYSSAKGKFAITNAYVDCSEGGFLHIEKNTYYRNRVPFSCDSKPKSYHVFSASYVDSFIAESGIQQNPNRGILIGHVKFKKSVRMQLWGADESASSESSLSNVERGNDLYFGRDGVIDPNLNRTTRSENFVILNAPEGTSYLQAFDKSGHTIFYENVMISPRTITVYY